MEYETFQLEMMPTLKAPVFIIGFRGWGNALEVSTGMTAYLVETHGVTMREAASLFLVPIIILTVFNLVAAPLLRRGIPVALLLGGSAAAQAAIWFIIPHSSDLPSNGVNVTRTEPEVASRTS